MISRRLVRAIVAVSAVVAPSGMSQAQGISEPRAAEAATESRALRIRPAQGPIQINADLTDAGWSDALRIERFIELEPREGAAPPVRTEVLLTYDEENLYVGFIAHDPNPRALRATLQPRDRLWSDDWVGILLDPYGDASVGYYFLSNPIGVQADMQLTAGREDSSIDFIFTTVGRVTDEGYIVEMAIPFRSLRLASRDVQSWGMMLVRNHPRSSRHIATWPSLSRNNPCQLCQLARLEGIEGVRAGGNLELLPAIVVSQAGKLGSGEVSTFEHGRPQVEPSLGVKYTLRPGWTAEATLNPDFSQVESEAAQVDVNTTFALFYPERRPFFQEGMDLYQTQLNVFYSRSINSPEVAAKLTGRSGSTNIGFIAARDEHTPFTVPFEERTAIVQGGRSFTNVLRAQRNFGGSHIGALATDRRIDGGGSGSTMSVDGLYRFAEIYSVSGHIVVSHTREPDDAELSESLPDVTFGSGRTRHTAAFDGESFAGHAVSLFAARNARRWSGDVLYREISPTYRADAGFQTQNDYRRASVWTGLTFYPNRHGVERLTTSLFSGTIWNFDGARKQLWIAPGLNATLPRQTSIGLNSDFREEDFRGVRLTGIRSFGFWVNSRFSDAVSAGFEVGAGRRVARNLAVPEVGEGSDVSVWGTIKPIQRMVIEPSLSYQQLHRLDGEEIFAGYIARTRINIQYNRALNLRTVIQYNDFNGRLDVEPLLVYQLNPLSIFYIGSTYGASELDGNRFVSTDRQYFAKLQYLFRR